MGRWRGVVGAVLVLAGCGPEPAPLVAATTGVEEGETGAASSAAGDETSTGGGSGGADCGIDCGVFAGACAALELAECPSVTTCASDPCSACGQMLGACALAGVACPELVAACTDLRGRCACDECEPVGEQTPDERLAICYEHPWPLGASCAAPDVGQCFAALGQAACRLTTCEYRGCVAAAATDPCGPPPPACAATLACGE